MLRVPEKIAHHFVFPLAAFFFTTTAAMLPDEIALHKTVSYFLSFAIIGSVIGFFIHCAANWPLSQSAKRATARSKKKN